MRKRTKAEEAALAAVQQKFHGQGRGFVQMGPRYWPPLDDTTSFAVDTHPLHGYSVLLERNDFTDLLAWLCGTKSGSHDIAGVQMSAKLTRGSDGLLIKVSYNSSPLACQSAKLNPAGVTALIEWMDDKEQHGWAGWKSGRVREELKVVDPSQCDWALNILVDRGTGYLADGDDMVYLTGPEDMSYEEWREYVNDYAGVLHVVEFCATPVSQGRWWKTGTKSMFRTSAKGY